jgi:hypothetical protein
VEVTMNQWTRLVNYAYIEKIRHSTAHGQPYKFSAQHVVSQQLISFNSQCWFSLHPTTALSIRMLPNNVHGGGSLGINPSQMLFMLQASRAFTSSAASMACLTVY